MGVQRSKSLTTVENLFGSKYIVDKGPEEKN